MLSENINRDHIYPLHFKIYSATGFWKINATSKWKRSFCCCYFYLVNFSFIFLTLVIILDACLVRNDVEKITTNLYTSVTCVGSFFKIWILLKKREKLEAIQDSLDKHLYAANIGKSIEDQNILVKNSRKLVKITIILYTLGLSLFFCWTIFPILDDNRKRFIFPFPLPHAKESPYYEIIFLYHAAMLLIIDCNVLTYDLIFYGFLIRICAQFEILAKNIFKINDLYLNLAWEKSIDNRDTILANNNRRERTIRVIKEIVIHHRAILKQIKEVDDVYRIPIFLQITCGATLIGVVAYGLIIQSQQSNLELMQRLFYAGAALFDILLYCHFGTKVVEKNENIKRMLYDNPWYEMDVTIKKLYLIIIANVQRKPRITGWGMYTITLGTYLDFLKISYNLAALLKGTRSRN